MADSNNDFRQLRPARFALRRDDPSQEVTVWNSEKIYNNAQEYFEDLEKEILEVQKSIDLEMFIFDDDPLGRRMVGVLCHLGKKGVQVRVMVDGVGSYMFFGHFGAQLISCGVQVKIFNPTPLGFTLLRTKFFPGLSRFMQFLWSSNRRNHRKVVILDQKTVWTGGINISAKEVETYSGKSAWRDTGIRVQGREIVEFLKAFEVAWIHAWSPVKFKKNISYYWNKYRSSRQVRGHSLVQLNFTRTLRRRTNWELVSRIRGARERLWITTAYFVPNPMIIRALKEAAERSVDVRVILPFKSDVLFMPWVSLAFYISLVKAGAKIYEYQPCMIHAKTVLIDEWGMVGSANINHRSIIHDLEVNVVVTTEAGIKSLSNQFVIDQEKSRLITVEEWKKKRFWKRLAGQILLYFQYWF